MASFRIVYRLFKSFLFNRLNYYLPYISLIYFTLGCSLTYIHYLNPLIRLVPLILITDHCILLLHLFFISLFILLYSILSITPKDFFPRFETQYIIEKLALKGDFYEVTHCLLWNKNEETPLLILRVPPLPFWY